MPELSAQNRIEITVDRALCIGSGDCVDSAPNVFQLDEEDKAVVVDPDGASVDEVIQAAGNCPVSAIFVVGEEGDLYPVGGALGRRQRGAHRLRAELLERVQQAADDRERLAVLVADPLALVARLDEEVERVPVCGQPGRAQHDRSGAADQLAQLVRQGGELAQLDHVVGGHLGIAEALGGAGRNGVSRRADLLLAEIEAREHNRVPVEVA